jgi:hypothetical protein
MTTPSNRVSSTPADRHRCNSDEMRRVR